MAPISFHVKLSAGGKHDVQLEPSQTVAEVKALLAEPDKANMPAATQRLIYKGKVLKDEQTLASIGVEAGHTVYLVRGSPPSATSSTPQSAQVPTATPTVPPSGGAGGPGGMDFGMGMGGLGDLGGLDFGLGLGGLGGMMGRGSFQEIQQQMMRNPESMREMLNSPMMQGMMQSLTANPQLLRTMVESNPALREVMDRHPELSHMLNDPALLQQTLDVARNPELLREQMRTTDRALNNIQSHPEGFNMLRRLYQDVQEPLMSTGMEEQYQASSPMAALAAAASAAAASGGADEEDDDNPFAHLFRPPAPPAQTGPNSSPLPNPWVPTQAATPPAGTGAAATLMNSLGMDVDPSLQGLMRDPSVQSVMRGLLADPESMSLLRSNHQMRDAQIDPETLRQLMDPSHLQAIARWEGARAGAARGGGATGNFFDPLGMGGPAAQPPETMYASQLAQLQDMGFVNSQQNIQALQATGGNIGAAIERLLSNM